MTSGNKPLAFLANFDSSNFEFKMYKKLLPIISLLLFGVAANAQNYKYAVDLTKTINDELKIDLITPKNNQGRDRFLYA